MPDNRLPIAMTIAGTDPSGGAGLAADLKTFAAHRVWGTAVVTAMTVQNTLGVYQVEPVTPPVIRAQMAAVLADIRVAAVKTGLLGTSTAVEAVAAELKDWPAGPLVVDPVLRATAGGVLLEDDAVDVLRHHLLPGAALVTPNLAEAAVLAGLPESAVTGEAGMVDAGQRILRTGVAAVLVTGGHLVGEKAADCLVTAQAPPQWLVADRVHGAGTHGSGCVLSAAVTARLALGQSLLQACRSAKAYVTAAISDSVRVGGGESAVNPPLDADGAAGR